MSDQLFKGFEAVRDIPLWGAFLALAGILIRQVGPWRKLSMDGEQQLRKELTDRVSELRKMLNDVSAALIKCEKECADSKVEFNNELLGLKRQHFQEQITFVRAVIDSVPNSPQLQLLLKTLERGGRSMSNVKDLSEGAGNGTERDNEGA